MAKKDQTVDRASHQRSFHFLSILGTPQRYVESQGPTSFIVMMAL